MQSAAGMTKEERLFIIARSDMLPHVSRGILKPTIQGKIMELMYISYTQNKETQILLQIKMQPICHLF